ncbi:polyketide cyclase/dehydrase/lipid transport protein [Nocardioides sp. J9]|uniref:SRPBCC family protein n=1 Tax=unclassified Nocardioides TaxID=2615069 RepID=UPI00048D0EE2|nr:MULTISPECIES: SRPBCC family protein [unclassified Nocardioides]TWG90244.1 polyketide cyclase/dehydrase/lipid transport protein [Nocardioides sp. J9]
MSTIQKTIHVDVPVRTAYDQWTQFESFPKFMQGVEQVDQLDDKRLHWRADIAGVHREWDAEIVHQEPDERITWRALDGTTNHGTVSFAADDAGAGTRVTLEMEFEPEGIVEKVGDALNIVDKKAEGDLERFKEFIEARGAETGGWRGSVSPTDVDNPTI